MKKCKAVIKSKEKEGHKVVYDSGAVRERPVSKGRYDLVSPFVVKRLALIYEEGAKKYADRNWEKGIPFSRVVDSALRHINQYLMGETDEDHLGHALWNLAALVHYEEAIKEGILSEELNDLPQYKSKKQKENL